MSAEINERPVDRANEPKKTARYTLEELLQKDSRTNWAALRSADISSPKNIGKPAK